MKMPQEELVTLGKTGYHNSTCVDNLDLFLLVR